MFYSNKIENNEANGALKVTTTTIQITDLANFEVKMWPFLRKKLANHFADSPYSNVMNSYICIVSEIWTCQSVFL